MDNLEASCGAMEEAGVSFKKKPTDGNMRGIAFAYDPVRVIVWWFLSRWWSLCIVVV